jgi:hypothetical protein
MEIITTYKGITIEYIEYSNTWKSLDNGEWGDSPILASLVAVREWIDKKEKTAAQKKKKSHKPIMAILSSSVRNTPIVCKVTSYAGKTGYGNEDSYWVTKSGGRREKVYQRELHKYDEKTLGAYKEKLSEIMRIEGELKTLLEPFDDTALKDLQED